MLFCTVDQSMVPILRSFIVKHMNNGVVPRLLGFDTADGLTTACPSRTSTGTYTIFRDLGIHSRELLHLMQWLRTDKLPEIHRQAAYETSLRLGGLDTIDLDMVEPSAKPHARPPMQPNDDTDDAYQWMISNVNTIDYDALTNHRWTVTTLVSEKDYYCYLRRLKSPVEEGAGAGETSD